MKKIVFIIFMAISLLNGGKLIKINLSNQKIYAIENGEIKFSGSISSGKAGHRTPNGTFRVLEKERYHVSDKYPEPNGGAKMPYMLRLTNKGIAIHKGPLPGYPASHGCIRVSKSTAIKLWRWAKVGTKVVIYGDASDFKYVKKRKKRKKTKYAANIKKRIKSKRRYSKRKYYAKRRVYRKPKPERTKDGYIVVEVYDSW